MFSLEYYESSKITFFTEHLWATASEHKEMSRKKPEEYWKLSSRIFFTTRFFYKLHFFNSASALLNFCMNWASNVA